MRKDVCRASRLPSEPARYHFEEAVQAALRSSRHTTSHAATSRKAHRHGYAVHAGAVSRIRFARLDAK